MRIIFMGTPEFAVPSLEILVENNYNVVAVITAPDKPAGRGLKLVASPVKEAALKHSIPVLQPEKLKNPEFLEELKSYKADLQVVVAFRMLPEVVWNMPPKGTFNLHASLLPDYRGAAPINWAIINGEKETGASTFFLQHEIDTGNIIFQDHEPISETDNVGTVYERLMHKGAKLVLKTVTAVDTGNYPQIPQDLSKPAKMAPKIFTETCEINFEQSVEKIYNFIRGLSPYPGAWTRVNGKTCKIFQAEKFYTTNGETLQPGSVSSDNKTYLRFKTTDGWIEIKELQIEGKKRMKIDEFLRGNTIAQ
ncbi:methionyl-tRNA formyltransferase [Xanthocytophaga agilis]|uniref:Methionyl-tRNA formyltransferase n=1 Tax=Xanthocytophaga agilis TaxID=3048010 RepID=A0AAE3UFG3_9BACT|nr:methionyl-tRNA formyltransferase [Xanthocytophaga agilis]MDJ1502396.1 methionyl-tRNA formyltransferase [Xanthocytophaga agilis]